MSPSALASLIVCCILAGGVASCSSTPPQEGYSVALASLPPEAALSSRPAIICFHANPGGKDALFEVIGIHPEQLAQLEDAGLDPSQWAGVFAVFVDAGDTAGEIPPVLGRYQVKDGTLLFSPRFDLKPGLSYRAVFSQARLDELAPLFLPADEGLSAPVDGAVQEARFSVPAPPRVATTVVHQIYPTADVLPENQLKFYLQFSAPMRQGEAYSHVHLVHSSGKQVELPFLELDEELWDWDGTRLTVFIDPGRVKRELTPHEELGPVLRSGEAYSLYVDEEWRDANGNPLKESFTKTFRVGPPDYDPPDPDTWSLEAPTAGTRSPLTVAFPEPLDHALLERVLWVADEEGQELPGSVEVETGERNWRFTPKTPWKAGEHLLVALSTLEDLAGNGIDRPFEVDIFQKVRKRVEVKRVEVRFSVK